MTIASSKKGRADCAGRFIMAVKWAALRGFVGQTTVVRGDRRRGAELDL
ncbi:MAG: hypothetical protein K2W81_09765 [Sphingomonas sp.]|nr:hypothetical protein [Sphingomonas sp.]MBY0284237.1 hypothetical protein [Sphingomonas sp.]